MSSISGNCDERFAEVREAFERAHGEPSARGAALAVRVDGETVADLWSGEMRAGRPWGADTTCCAFSVAKAVTATAVAVLVDRGVLDLDTPVATWWPEFGAAGKAETTLRMVLTHRAATNWFPDYAEVVSCDDAASFGNLERIWAAIAAAPPVWPQDGRVGYTSMTMGWIVSAILDRVDGRRLSAFVAEEIAGPLGLDSLHLGVPDDRLGLVADLEPSAAWDSEQVLAKINPNTNGGKGLFLARQTLGRAMDSLWNDDLFRGTEHGAINLVTTARDMAALFGVWAGRGTSNGVPLFGEATANEFMRAQAASDQDVAIGTPLRLGVVFWRPVAGFQFGPRDEAVAHIGLGGAVGMADPVANVAIGYVPAQLQVESVFATDARLQPAISAVFKALG